MPKRSRELSAMEVGRLREEGDHNVGGIPGLYLQIIDGSRAWILRYTIGARRRRMEWCHDWSAVGADSPSMEAASTVDVARCRSSGTRCPVPR